MQPIKGRQVQHQGAAWLQHTVKFRKCQAGVYGAVAQHIQAHQRAKAGIGKGQAIGIPPDGERAGFGASAPRGFRVEIKPNQGARGLPCQPPEQPTCAAASIKQRPRRAGAAMQGIKRVVGPANGDTFEVVDVGGSGVLPHERTTPKAKTDRLDLTRATRANLSPVWGLSLTAGLTSLLEEPGDLVSSFVDDDGVTHQIERVSQPTRISAIRYAVSSHPVLIADGHHRYAISRTYRDEQRSQSGDNASELTMTYVAELVEEQLSVAAIHRLYDLSPSQLISALEGFYVPRAAGPVSAETLQTMDSTSCMCLVDASGNGTFLEPIETAFPGVREMDSARLEYALRDTTHAVQYQHGVDEVLHAIHTGVAQCAVLIRPVSIDEIRRTAHTGDLMPPKSTFFTPKLRTGLVMRSLDA